MILITGATGKVGGRVAALLAATGQKLRLFARDPGRAPRLPLAEVAAGSYEDAKSLDIAMRGVDSVFIVSVYGPPGKRARLHMNVMDAAARAEARHVVYLSFQGASSESLFPYARDHAESEDHLRQSGLGFTILRDCLYLDVLPGHFAEGRAVRGPAGEGRTAFVAREDVARVASAMLTAPKGKDATYDLTGPQALTFTEVAEKLSALVGRPLRYENETLEEARRWRRASGAPEWQVETWIGSYLATAAGELREVSGTVERITGRKPYSLEQYFRERPELLAKLRTA